MANPGTISTADTLLFLNLAHPAGKHYNCPLGTTLDAGAAAYTFFSVYLCYSFCHSYHSPFP